MRVMAQEVFMRTLKMALAVAGVALATQAAAQITLYDGEGFRGPAVTADKPVYDFDPFGFNDRAKSLVVNGGTWQVCEDAQFQGRCVVLQPGNYESLRSMGMSERISSVRPVDRVARYDYAPAPVYGPPPGAYGPPPGAYGPPPGAYGPPPGAYGPPPGAYSPPPDVAAAPGYGYQATPSDRLYQVPVTSVHAVVGPPEQRCWVERQQVYEDRRGANVPGAIAGAVIGGILGHQVGGGRGRDVATAGGAVAGAAIGANVGRGDQSSYAQDVQRCENVQGQLQPDYWDVTYNFRGIEHHVQMSVPPGPTLTVDDNGDPRG
jgi:uncharacterized protein YcfJ